MFPIIGPLLSGHTLLVYLAYLSRAGRRLLPLPDAVGSSRARRRRSRGRRVRRGHQIFAIKFQTMLLSGLFCGLAGAYLSLGYVSLFAKQMTNERGLIALAAIFFANGNPYWTAAVALLFGAATALSVRLPQVTGAAPQLLQLIPYVVTVLALVAVGVRKTRAAIGTAPGASNFDGAQAHSIVRQLRPHGLDHEVDERLRDVEVELSVGISCDLGLERPLASPGRKLLEVLARRLAKKRHL